MSYDEQHRRPGDLDGVPGAYEHPTLDSEPGYWAETWAEFKRRMGYEWHENQLKETTYLVAATWVFVFIDGYWLGWL